MGLRGEVNLEAIKQAVRSEQREAAKSIRLNALEVIDHTDGIFQIIISGFPRLDWTWEGASAFRPIDIDNIVKEPKDVKTWKAVVVGIDPDESSIYVSSSPESDLLPHRGPFLVKPFDFLQALSDLLDDATSNESMRTDLQSYFQNTESFNSGANRPLKNINAIPESLWESSWAALWGPPGTGKTYTIGKLVAEAAAGSERILVVSTTNKATDAAAISIGKELLSLGSSLDIAARLGTGADLDKFEQEGISDLLVNGETEIRRNIARVKKDIAKETDQAKKAKLQRILGDLQQSLKEVDSIFQTNDKKVIITTSYYALRRLVSNVIREKVGNGYAPFSTVILDEAGLLSRVISSAIALLTSKRILFVGDPKQLAPISKMSRLLVQDKAKWLATSTLSNLTVKDANKKNVHLLTKQYRMSPEIGNLISNYQYGGLLQNSNDVIERKDERDQNSQILSRCLWYVLDDDAGGSMASIRAVRGPGNRSWIRPRSKVVFDKLIKYFTHFQQSEGLFITPFAAQARDINHYLKVHGYSNWSASTIHAQQGSEAKWIIFDTVNASSTGWPFEEWKRLINVAISRAREHVILIASRAEMQEPYLSTLAVHFSPGHIEHRNWRVSELAIEYTQNSEARNNPHSLGAQISDRNRLRPVLSGDQERLCGYVMDGKARLVRGVAGSGKTYVLANWLAKTLSKDEFPKDGRVWVMYANESLKDLIQTTILDVWSNLSLGIAFPHDRVVFLHLRDVVLKLANEFDIVVSTTEKYEYDLIAKRVLENVAREELEERCDALFIDEGQDFGHNALELCFALVKPFEPNSTSKPVMLFYDNAQDLYRRGMPTWTKLGLDVRGRSTVMKESFRSTRQVCEFSLNVLFSLSDAVETPDYRELIQNQLLEKVVTRDEEWWRIHFNRIDGPHPIVRNFESRDQEMIGLLNVARTWIVKEGIAPGDIKVICNNKYVRKNVFDTLKNGLIEHGVDVVLQTSRTFIKQADTLIVTTAHSYKGYEGEAIIIPAAEEFAVKRSDDVLSSALYVAMTRARSLLYVSCTKPKVDGPKLRIVNAINKVDRLMRNVSPDISIELRGEEAVDEREKLLEPRLREAVKELRKRYQLKFDPLFRVDGSVLAEPVVWYEDAMNRYAGFDGEIEPALQYDLEDEGVRGFVM